MPKQRIHNEYFRRVSLGNRKSCPTCKELLDSGESIWSWGEYHNAKWRTVKHFCKKCFRTEVAEPLKSHTTDCGCDVSLCVRGECPDWLTLSSCEVCK